jgi:hypothetical protein
MWINTFLTHLNYAMVYMWKNIVKYRKCKYRTKKNVENDI